MCRYICDIYEVLCGGWWYRCPYVNIGQKKIILSPHKKCPQTFCKEGIRKPIAHNNSIVHILYNFTTDIYIEGFRRYKRNPPDPENVEIFSVLMTQPCQLVCDKV